MGKKNNKNKLILLICDGHSDDLTLHDCIKNYSLKKVKNIDVKVLKGDLAYKDNINKDNCKEKLNEIITEFLGKHHVLITDVAMIIHIIDTDCAFIDPALIVEDLQLDDYPRIIDEVYYTSKYRDIVEKFKNKKEIYSFLSNMHVIRSAPYYVYYFSRNLEHSIYNRLNVSKDDKIKLALKFDENYSNNIPEFKKLFNDILFDVPFDYDKSWEYILSNNSFKRCSNIALLLDWIDKNL